MRSVGLFVMFAACGRVNFEPVDLGQGPDAGGDAGSDSTVGPFCGTRPFVFCDDFDRPGTAETGWDTATLNGGTAELVTDVSVSAPASLLIALPAGSSEQAFLQQTFPAFSSSIELLADISLDAFDAANEADFFVLNWDTLPAGCSVFAFNLVRDVNLQSVILQETYVGCGGLVETALVFPAGFHQVRLFITGGASARVKLTIDGGLVLDKPIGLTVPSSTTNLRAGISFLDPNSGPWRVRFDNIGVLVQ